MEKIKKAVKFIQGFAVNLGEKHMSAYAAQAAYFIILSFIPFMLLLMTSIKYTPLTREEVINVVMQVFPVVLPTHLWDVALLLLLFQ